MPIRKTRTSIFYSYKEEIIKLLSNKSSIPFIARELNRKHNIKISATGLHTYIKREKLQFSK